MANTDDSITWLELAKAEALRLGVILTDKDADWILWEETSFPFDEPDEIRRQVVDFIEKHGKSFKPKTAGPTAWDKLEGDEP
jgi:hypothetical protein